VIGEPGDLIFKPRNQWHTFWNDGDEPARLLEIISPAGFERYFDEMVDLPREAGRTTPEARAELAERYGLEVDPGSVPRLLEKYGLRLEPFTSG
jgi:gentisate 1,2-dioxygenase